MEIEKRTAGRPKVKRSKAKSQYLSIRLSRPQMSSLRSKSRRKGLSLSNYVREILKPKMQAYY